MNYLSSRSGWLDKKICCLDITISCLDTRIRCLGITIADLRPRIGCLGVFLVAPGGSGAGYCGPWALLGVSWHVLGVSLGSPGMSLGSPGGSGAGSGWIFMDFLGFPWIS